MTTDSRNSWYSASLLFRSDHSASPPDAETGPLWEESIVLIEATSEHAARVQATELGHARQHSYRVSDTDVATWKFVTIERVCHIDSEGLSNGLELFARFLRDSEVRSLLTKMS